MVDARFLLGAVYLCISVKMLSLFLFQSLADTCKLIVKVQ